MMIDQWIMQLKRLLVDQSTFVKGFVWIILLALLVLVVYVIFSLLFFPLMTLYNRLTDKNKTNVMAQNEYLIGELTEKIQGDSIGEVMEIGSHAARTVYPAKFYRTKDREEGLLLAIGTKVLIIDFDEKGCALVIKSNQLGE